MRYGLTLLDVMDTFLDSGCLASSSLLVVRERTKHSDRW
jgi:hypothetical protein